MSEDTISGRLAGRRLIMGLGAIVVGLAVGLTLGTALLGRDPGAGLGAALRGRSAAIAPALDSRPGDGSSARSAAGTTLAGQTADGASPVSAASATGGAKSLTSTAAAKLGEDELAMVDLFRNASRSVVFITSLTMRRDVFRLDLQAVAQGSGTGFVWDDKGHVVTNYHVIRNANAAKVTLADQTTWDAHLVGVSPEKDLAVLRIEAPHEKLQALTRGTSHDLLVGQNVLAIGNPFGLDHTLTTGVVSALGREIQSMAGIPIRDVIQTDAAINPGNSGGPLLDSSGRLIGVSTAIFSPSGAYAGIGFAIPVDTVAWVVPDLIEHGKVVRPALGVQVASAQVAERLGVDGALILAVAKNGSAERAGLRPTRRDRNGQTQLGDVIVALGGYPVHNSGDLFLALERFDAGDEVDIAVRREGRDRTIRATLDASA